MYPSSVKCTLEKKGKKETVMVRVENVTGWETGHSSQPCSVPLLGTCCCSWLDSWVSSRFEKCHVSFVLDEPKGCLYFLSKRISWAKILSKHRTVTISQLLFPLNFHITFEGKVLYFYMNIRNSAIEKCHLDNHTVMSGIMSVSFFSTI